MKKRNIMAVILFSIITLGIYDLFWLASVKKELHQKAKTHVPSMWVLFTPILVMIAAIIAMIVIVASHSTTNADGTVSSTGNGVGLAFGLVYAVALLVVLPVTFYWFFKFSKAVKEYTNGELSTAMTFILLWILRFIGMAIIQDKFNEMLDNGTNGDAAASTTGYVAPTATPGFGEQTPPTGTPGQSEPPTTNPVPPQPESAPAPETPPVQPPEAPMPPSAPSL